MVRTLDSESSNPSSNLGGTLFFSMFLVLYIEGKDVITHNQPQRARVLALPLPHKEQIRRALTTPIRFNGVPSLSLLQPLHRSKPNRVLLEEAAPPRHHKGYGLFALCNAAFSVFVTVTCGCVCFAEACFGFWC